ncbi:MAG: retroviral-like aspartic protease family protein [Magnetococcus sp. XQGC-1]
MNLSRAVQERPCSLPTVPARKLFSLLLWSLLALPVAEGAAAEIHQCVRADGERIFKNFPCQKGEKSAAVSLPPTGSSSTVKQSEMPVGPLEIPLITQQPGGGYWVNVKLNETVTGRFVVDTGASNLLLPEEMFEELQRNGLTTQDQMGTSQTRIADGSLVEVRDIHLQRVALGGRGIEHVLASVGKRGISPLFGANVLERFGKWYIDAEKSKLILEGSEGEIPTDRDGMIAANCLKQKGRVDHFQEQFKKLRETHNREWTALQAARAKLDAEKSAGIRGELVERYNADVATFQQNSTARKTNHAQLLDESRRLLESYNKRCLARVYQEANGNWQRFTPYQVITESNPPQ